MPNNYMMSSRYKVDRKNKIFSTFYSASAEQASRYAYATS